MFVLDKSGGGGGNTSIIEGGGDVPLDTGYDFHGHQY